MADLGVDEEESFDDMVKGCPEMLDPIHWSTDDDGQVDLEVPDRVLPSFREYDSEPPACWKPPTYSEKKMSRLKSAVPAGSIDLHCLTVKEAWNRLNKQLVGALRAGVKYVEIIHGKGTGAIRLNSRNWLIGSKWVLAYCEQHGNSGAVVAELKCPKPKK